MTCYLPARESLLQRRLAEISNAAEAHDMRINLDKTKVIAFKFTRKYRFEPCFSKEGTNLEVVQETKLLGLTVSNDCRWDKNTKYIVQTGQARLWFLRRLKLLGASRTTSTNSFVDLSLNTARLCRLAQYPKRTHKTLKVRQMLSR